MGPTAPRKATCLCAIGTRPEAIKMAPVVRALAGSGWAIPHVVTTGQHSDLLAPTMAAFALNADTEIVLPPCGSMTAKSAQILARLDQLIDQTRPDFIIAQGDTNSVTTTALSAFYRQIPFVHVEAGLRTGDLSSPFPEEFNRRLVSLATKLHCAPTVTARNNLLREGIPPEECIVSGNTVIDALLQTAETSPEPPADFPQVRRPILVTAHRRENQGNGFEDAFRALRTLVERFPDVAMYFPMHPNPGTQAAARQLPGQHPRIVLAQPLGYREMVGALRTSWLVLTDSGGLQEEGPALGKPVLVMRDTTERPEAVQAGSVELVGTEAHRIVTTIEELYRNEAKYNAMAKPRFPYGDGTAAAHIVTALEQLWAGGRGRQWPDSMRCVS